MAESEHLDADLEALVLDVSGALAIVDTQVVQSLWSGYGHIVRCRLEGGKSSSVVLKHVRWPEQRHHRYGWSSDTSHERKLRSYQIETAWYQRYASICPDGCRVPRSLALRARLDGVVLVLEDLDTAGFAGRSRQASVSEVDSGLSWLASFHATFMGTRPDGLWGTGTYWHLATRRDEYDALPEGPLRAAAGTIDRRLTESAFQTLVHGDAKLANFCFSSDGRRAAAVDFQYVGGGCGMKDVAYFIGSCFDEGDCESLAPYLLDRYFELLARALGRSSNTVDVVALEQDWRSLYPVAWTDYYRFLQGWKPDHWKLHRYSETLADEVLQTLGFSELS